jgi:hypothetical protein
MALAAIILPPPRSSGRSSGRSTCIRSSCGRALVHPPSLSTPRKQRGHPCSSGDRLRHEQRTRSQHISLTPVAVGESGSGFVENIHANGPNIYAHEQYVLNNGLPSTTYQVVIHLSALADTTCSAPFLVLPTASLTTNVAGKRLRVPRLYADGRRAAARCNVAGLLDAGDPGGGGIQDKLRDHRARLIPPPDPRVALLCRRVGRNPVGLSPRPTGTAQSRLV